MNAKFSALAYSLLKFARKTYLLIFIQERIMIRELTKGEIEQVDGGFGFPGAALGAVGSGVASWRAGDSAGQIAVNAG